MSGPRAGGSAANSAADSVARLRNDDITWEGSLVGLVPDVTGPAASYLLTLGEDAVPFLLGAVSDTSKFAAAHVLLTEISGARLSDEGWNGLLVDLSADGRAHFDASQASALTALWCSVLDS